MTSKATILRDAVRQRVIESNLFKRVSTEGFPQVQPDQLPYAAVFISRERLTPDGQGNMGELAFISDTSIAVQIIRGFDHLEGLASDIDKDLNAIEAWVLRDPIFTQHSAYFESIESIDRERLFPREGETYWAELRWTVVFRSRVSYEPDVTDDYEGFDTTTRPAGHPTAPAIIGRFDQEQD